MENNTYENYNEYPQYPPQADALAGSVLTKGILSLAFACTVFVSFLGIIFGAQGKNLAARCAAMNGGYLPAKAKVGRALSIAGFIAGIVMTACFTIGFLAGLAS